MGFRTGSEWLDPVADASASPGWLMTQLILILLIAFILFAVVGRLLRDALRGGEAKHPAVEPASPLPVQVQLPARALMEQIFSEDDLSFVTGEGDRQIRRQFLHDRRKLALAWLSQMRKESSRIIRLHLQAVSTSMLRPAIELQLLLHIILFFSVYALLWGVITCYGAFAARSMIRNVLTLAGRLSGLGGSILADAGRSGLAHSH